MATATTNTATTYSKAYTTPTHDLAALVGRILMALLFVPAGFQKLTGFGDTVGYIASVGLPLPAVAAVIAIVVELGVGLAFLAGFKTRWAALALALFTLAASFGFHNFWSLPADQVMVNQLMFFKNIAVAGGLLAFAAFGAGRFSIDRR